MMHPFCCLHCAVPLQILQPPGHMRAALPLDHCTSRRPDAKSCLYMQHIAVHIAPASAEVDTHWSVRMNDRKALLSIGVDRY